MIKVPVNRATWGRYYLCNVDYGCFCVTGSILSALGVPQDSMHGVRTLFGLPRRYLQLVPENFKCFGGSVVMELNDDFTHNPDQREEALTLVCRQYGFELQFEGSYP